LPPRHVDQRRVSAGLIEARGDQPPHAERAHAWRACRRPNKIRVRNIFDLASFSQFTRGARMHVSTHEAAAIYARAFRARFGRRASQLAQDRIRKFRKSGDSAGVEIWTNVAIELERLPTPTMSTILSSPKSRKRSSGRTARHAMTRTDVMREAGPGTRADSTDRGAMLEAFRQRFTGLSARQMGRLFDRYRLSGRLDIRWNAQTGRYVVTLIDSN